MLQIKNLTIYHKKDLRTLLENFSMALNQGDKAAIIGEEGNGKSTLLKLIYQPQQTEEYVEYTGEIITNGSKIGYLAQELPKSYCGKSIYDVCTARPGFYDLPPKELADISRQLQLETEIFYSEQWMEELSGGEKIKVQLALLLMEKPDILLLDEPSNDLDMDTLEWLEIWMRSCRLPILFVSHDEVLIENTANKIIHLEQVSRKTSPRATVTRCGYKEYMDNRENRFYVQEKNSKKEKEEYEKQQERFQKIQQKVEHQQNIITRQNPHGGRLLKKKMHAVKALEHRFERENENRTKMPEWEKSIFIRFQEKPIPNGKIILDYSLKILENEKGILAKNLELFVQGPEKVCIIGKNGVGKTTFLRKIAEELSLKADIKICYVPQNYEEVMEYEQTPVEFLVKTGDKEEESRIRTYLGSMKYTAEEMKHSIKELSGGQKAKLYFLKISMEGPDVLILDEPTRNFSPLSNPVIRGLLKDFKGAIISVSHDRKYIQEVCNTIYEMTPEGMKKVEIS